jgi:tetratricopeptide (TPR) repeat protein
LLETGKVEESIPLFERAITIDESHFDSFHSLGVALRAAGRPAEAEEIFRRALKRQPQSGIALVGLGDALFDQQRYLEAENYYIQAAAIDSRNASAHSHRALAILAANPESVRAKVEARSLIQKAIDVDPEDPSVLCNVGILLAYIGDLNSSVKYLRQSVEQGSAQWSCQFELASSLVQMGKYDEALVHAKAADGLKPSTPKILKLLAGINRKLGHQAEFQAAVQRLKDLGATNEAARTKAALAGGSKEN